MRMLERSAMLWLVCASVGACAVDDLTVAQTEEDLNAGAASATNGALCVAGRGNLALQPDCLTVEYNWAGAGARPITDGNKVYTGIDKIGRAHV